MVSPFVYKSERDMTGNVELLTTYKQYVVLSTTIAHNCLKLWITTNITLKSGGSFDILLVPRLWIDNFKCAICQHAVDKFVNNIHHVE